MRMTSWAKELREAVALTGDEYKYLTCTLSRAELAVEFDPGYGAPKGKPFTAWSDDWVYFPAEYDGAEWVAWVPRNPCGIAKAHVGGS
ncbi:MAG: hypothetical protein GF393_10620 [Armatimonadia bacterium]|nr:hypothetical protein [Armatimonadia bacterium]